MNLSKFSQALQIQNHFDWSLKFCIDIVIYQSDINKQKRDIKREIFNISIFDIFMHDFFVSSFIFAFSSIEFHESFESFEINCHSLYQTFEVESKKVLAYTLKRDDKIFMIIVDLSFDRLNNIFCQVSVLQVASSQMMIYKSTNKQIFLIKNDFDLIVAINHFLQVRRREFNMIVREFDCVDLWSSFSFDDEADSIIEFLMKRHESFDDFMQSNMFDFKDFNDAIKKLTFKTNSSLHIGNKQKDMRHIVFSSWIVAATDLVFVFKFETWSYQKITWRR